MIREKVLAVPRMDEVFDVTLGGSYAPLSTSLTDSNWKLYAARHYNNPQSIGEEEFLQDVKRFKYIKKALTRYKTTGELPERLILNHLIVLNNVFGPRPLCRLLFLKMPEYLPQVKPFLLLLRILPKKIDSVGGRDWITDDIPIDTAVIEALRRI